MNSIITNVGRVIVGKVLPNEDIIDAISELAIENNITSGLVNIIGALKKATIGFFDLNKKEYNFKTFEEPFEIISCMGNIAYSIRGPIIHLHISLGREDFSVIGGHLSQPSIISITGEVYIYEINTKIIRSEDLQSKLFLLDV
ncbi:MAG: PPC domain-containing DNA-binding protein [Promethearchaeota archaeon]